MSEILGLKNVNMLSRERYDGLDEPANDELWAVETETYSDGDGNWYRIYPDGWCEQGGYTEFAASGTTVNFLKPFKDLPNIVLGHKAAQTNHYATGASIDEVTLSSFKAHGWKVSGTNAYFAYWKACGYIA